MVLTVSPVPVIEVLLVSSPEMIIIITKIHETATDLSRQFCSCWLPMWTSQPPSSSHSAQASTQPEEVSENRYLCRGCMLNTSYSSSNCSDFHASSYLTSKVLPSSTDF